MHVPNTTALCRRKEFNSRRAGELSVVAHTHVGGAHFALRDNEIDSPERELPSNPSATWNT